MLGEQGVVIRTKDLIRGLGFASRCYITGNLYISFDVVKETAKEDNIMLNQSLQTAPTHNILLSSVARLKETKVITFCGMMGALSVILGYVATIKFGQYIRIGFSGLPNQIVDYLFGPWIGAIFGGAMDIIKWFVSGDGDFFIGFTITAMVGAIIYGLFTYNKPLKIWRIIAAQVLVKLVCNIILNTLWLNLLYGKAIAAILPGRLVSNAVMLPIDTIIMYLMLQVVQKVIKPAFDK